MTALPVSLEQQVKARIDSLAYLPTTAAVAMKFVELGKDPEADPAQYAKTISADSSLSSKLLALANSSWYGVRNKVTKPHVAINLLGLGTVRTLAISYCLTGLHNDLRLSSDESRRFWSASLCKAVAAAEFARIFDGKLAEEAFTAALFQDFALPIMFACAREQVSEILADSTLDAASRLRRERELFRLDHAEFGRAIAQKLELPDLFIDAVAFHHAPTSLHELLHCDLLADALSVAALFPHDLDAWNPADAAELRRRLAANSTNQPINPAEFLQSVQAEFVRVYAFFESNQSPEVKLVELLEQATREAADSTTRLVTTVQELLQQAATDGKAVDKLFHETAQLEQAVTRDSLTLALNREGFTQHAATVLARAQRYSTTFALIYLDADDFKTVNDLLGHAAGDLALKSLVAAVNASIRQTDCVARLGGDEFAILLDDIAQPDAIASAERILARITATTITGRDSVTRKLAASAGLVWVNPAGLELSLPALLNEADRLMYQAKQAGGNVLRATALDTPAHAR